MLDAGGGIRQYLRVMVSLSAGQTAALFRRIRRSRHGEQILLRTRIYRLEEWNGGSLLEFESCLFPCLGGFSHMV